jgi:hypothetical protein
VFSPAVVIDAPAQRSELDLSEDAPKET